ncbi:hypothetical protein ARMA_1210 [Ardenticatena maritima]|uniref:Uncharacterized protein n=1 Tax=Ardenticatena maritima TaxID=872965 RepID=A0A0M9UCC5_9CHLR|nr:hypothetical protein ARMA_1210 [Ardenticatena maritima]
MLRAGGAVAAQAPICPRPGFALNRGNHFPKRAKGDNGVCDDSDWSTLDA